MEIQADGQGRAARAHLERKSVLNQAGSIAESGCQFGDQQAVGTLCDLRGTRDDQFGDPDLVHFHHVIHVIPHDLHRDGREGHDMIRDHDHFFGILIISQRIAESAAGRRTVQSVAIAEGICRGRCQHGNVDLDLAVLNGLIAAAL